VSMFAILLAAALPAAEPTILEGDSFRLSVDSGGAGFVVEDARGSAAWKAVGVSSSLDFRLEREKRSIRISWRGDTAEALRLLPAVTLAPGRGSFLVVPVREGLLIPADEGPAFRREFGTSEYEGCHMNMIGLAEGGAVAVVTWEDPSVTAEVERTVEGDRRALSLSLTGRKGARSVLFTPIGKGGIDEIAAAYRRIAAEKGLRQDLKAKMATRPALERLIGATNFKLWTCLDRKMSEDSKREESVEVHWTFPEAAEVAEHLKRDLEIDRCLFTLGGWIHRGYDCQHPDILPAAPECGGNEALAAALARIRALGYADCLHDNYQDIYRDSPSWSEGLIQKRADGSLAAGGRWLGGRAYLVCAQEQVRLAKRPQNLSEVKRLFAPLTYFIDTTYAVGPQECSDPSHPLSRADDIRLKAALSDYAREVFGVFGSECGREWAIPHSDFFEGLVGVSGKYFHNLDPASLGAVVVPFFEMVYHDCEAAWGKYGFDPDKADETVVHHVACARTLYHHGIPRGLYWKRLEGDPPATGAFTRADGGWAEGLCRTDRFLKNTHEVLGPLNRETACMVLEKLEFLSHDRSLRRMTWGSGEVTVTCNYGNDGAAVRSALGGEVVLPRWGFLIESPRFVAFHSSSWGGAAFTRPALFTLTSLDGKSLASAARIRAFHAFGPADLALRGKKAEIRREVVLEFPETKGN
jgi:hypothetical protein